jgi:hypothetical protein
MSASSRFLVAALRAPAEAAAWPLETWDRVIPQARSAGLLARLGAMIEAAGALERLPAEPREHLVAAGILAAKHRRDVGWEVRCLARALEPLRAPIVLLKGAAYAIAGLPPAAGRVFNDIDIMVPKARLNQAEALLQAGGWQSQAADAYDQHYYRAWMHQLPPMRHHARKSVVDVHHTIVPETARAPVAGEVLAAAALPIAGQARLMTLGPCDMVLHSATHLFNEGEFRHGLRDLMDLADLLRHFGRDAGFGAALGARAEELGLTRPLVYAIREGRRWLGPAWPSAGAAEALAGRTPSVAERAMEVLLKRALQPQHPSCRDALTRLARGLLYVRGHALRMPPRLLLPHLMRKAASGREAA